MTLYIERLKLPHGSHINLRDRRLVPEPADFRGKASSRNGRSELGDPVTPPKTACRARQHPAKASPAKPSSIIAQMEGSGTEGLIVYKTGGSSAGGERVVGRLQATAGRVWASGHSLAGRV